MSHDPSPASASSVPARRRRLALVPWAVVLLAVFAASLEAATLTNSGSVLTLELAASEQVTASTDGSTYTLVSNQTFVDGGVAAPGSDFSGFGTNTLTVEASGLTRYSYFLFTDAGDGADLVFASGSGSWQDAVETQFDGTGSSVSNNGPLATVAPLQWAAESLELAADITGDTIQFDSPVSLTASVELDGAFNTVFNSSLDGAHALTLASPVVILAGDVGGTTPLTSLSVGAVGSTDLGPSVSTSGTQTYANAVSTAAGGTVLRAADLVFSGPSVSGAGTLGIAPADPADPMAVGTTSSTGGLHLDDAELALLADGFSGLELGRADATGLSTVDSATFLDALTLRGGDVRVEGIVEVDGDLTVEGELIGGASGLTPGSDYGQLRVLGAGRTVTLGAGSLSLDAFDFSSVPGDAVTLIDLDQGTSVVSGTFDGLAEGATFGCGIVRCAISYVGGDGNDVVVEVASVLDFGDAPDPGAGTGAGNYKTRLADNGPRHDMRQPIHLGPSRDAEPDGIESATATGDDLDWAAPSDEDGLAIGRIDLDVTTGAPHTVALHVTNEAGADATLSGWIDHNRDGTFANATERAQVVVPDGTVDGMVTLTFPAAPTGSATDSTFARFRISTDPAASNSTGAASDGEVEDHAVRIFEPSRAGVRSTTSFSFSQNTDDRFGRAIADVGDVDGDGVSDLVVGKPADGSGPFPAISVLLMNADGSVQSGTNITYDGSGDHSKIRRYRFGAAVAPLGDFDGDGVPDVAVGEWGWATSYNVSPNEGRLALVLLNADGTEKDRIYWRPSRSGSERFGYSVAQLGDLDGNGIVDLAVGSPFLSSQTGGVSILFLDRDGTVLSEKLLTNGVNGTPGMGTGQRFGSGVAALGDLDGDGVTELAVGAESSGPGIGRLYVLFLNRDGTVRAHVLHDSGSPGMPTLANGDRLGGDVAALGDLDGDGFGDLAVGLPERGTGEVLVLFLGADGSINSRRTLGHEQGGVGSLPPGTPWGRGLAKWNDRDGNGTPELLFGAPVASSAYLLRLNLPPTFTDSDPTSWTFDEDPSPAPTLTLNATDGEGDTLTWSIAAAASNGLAEVSGTGTSQTVTYTPNPDFAGMDSFEVAVDDGLATDTLTVQVTVEGINDPPAITAPASIPVTEDTASALTGISFSDVDAGSDPLVATLTVPAGTLTPTFGTGVVVGGTDTARTLTGTLSQLNSYFTNGHLTYTTAENATADVTLGVSIDDLGNSGARGNLTANQNVTLTVAAVNDSPEVSAPVSSSVTEDTATALTGISLADVDVGTQPMQLTITVPSGTLEASSGPNVTVGGDGSSMTLLGKIFDLNGFLANDRVTYTPALDDTSDVTVQLLADDLGNSGSGGNRTDSRNVTLTVDPVNDAPEVTLPAPIDVPEDVATAITGISFSDVDAEGADLVATLTVPSGNLTPTYGTGVVVGGTNTARTLTGTLSQLNSYFANGHLTYTTAQDVTDDVTLGLVIDDLGNTGTGGSLTDSGNVTLNVTAVNDAPTITAPATISVTEDQATALHELSFADVDAGSDPLTATLTVASGTLAAVDGGGVTVGGTATARTLTGSVSDLNGFLANDQVTYTTAEDATDDVTLAIAIDDQGHTGSGGVQTALQDVTLQVDAVNDAPTITAPATITVTEDTESGLPGISLADVDAGNEVVRATLTVARGELAASSGSGVTVGGASDTVLTLEGTIAALNAFLAVPGVTYRTAEDDVADVTLGVAIDDLGNTGTGGSLADSQDVPLTVAAVNDAPSFSITPDLAVDVDEGPQTVEDFAFDLSPGPADEAGQVLSFTVTDNTFPSLFSAGPALSSDGTLTFTSAEGAFGDATITVTLSDDGGTANGGVDTSPEQSFDIRVGEQVAPEVVAVSGTPGGALVDCTQLSERLVSFTVEFSEAMANPDGDGDPQDVTNPTNYEIWAAGPDHDLETLACGAPVGDDQLVAPAAVVWDGGLNQAEVSLVEALADGPYRLLVCPDLEDAVGNPLGDAFAVTFRQDASNLYRNGALDCGLDDWMAVSPVAAEIDHSTEDRDDATISGSARVQRLSTGSDFSLAQCLEIGPGGLSRISGAVRVDVASPDLELQRFCLGSPQPGCAAPGEPLDLASMPLSGTGGSWDDFASDHPLPEDAVSALCTVNVHSTSEDSFDLFLDTLRLSEAPFFADGFESGDTSAW